MRMHLDAVCAFSPELAIQVQAGYAHQLTNSEKPLEIAISQT